jgi:hypothetical protein
MKKSRKGISVAALLLALLCFFSCSNVAVSEITTALSDVLAASSDVSDDSETSSVSDANDTSTTVSQATDDSVPKTESSGSPVTEQPVVSSTEESSQATDSTSPVTTTEKKPAVTTTKQEPSVTTTQKKVVTTTTAKKQTNEPSVGTSITVKFVASSSAGGSISGTTTQTIRYGQTKTTSVTARANLGYRFAGWSDGVTTANRSGESFTSSQTITATFEIDALDLPILYLTTNGGAQITSKETYIGGTISVLNTDNQYLIDSLDMEIRGRGNYTWSNSGGKPPYKIKLSEKKNLLGEGNGKAKIWTLIADHCDQALLRNWTVLNFTRQYSCLAWNSAASSVEVYLNGEYRGVYLLCEQNQVNKNRVAITEEPEATDPSQTGYLIELSGYAEDPKFSISGNGYSGPSYQIISDLSTSNSLKNKQISYIQDYLQRCWNAVAGGKQSEVEALMDIDSLVDSYLIEELFKNLDAGWDSFYMYKDVDGKLYFGPIWDFDQCGGNADEGCENYEGLRGGITNIWFKTLLKTSWFKQLLTKRWNELKSKIDTIPTMITTQAKKGYNSYCRNFEKWQIFGQKINRETATIRALSSYKEHYEYFANWMKNRIAWLDSYWNDSSFTYSGELTLSGSGTSKNPYKVTSAADFLNLTLYLQNGNTLSGKYILQTADIDMTSVSGYSGMGSEATFAGIYDGGGHSITVNISDDDGSIFPYVEGIILNVVAKGSVSNSGIASGLCRSVRSTGVLLNCVSTVKVSSSGAHAGGLTGSNQSGAIISNCYFGGSVSSSSGTGPFCVWYNDRPGTFTSLYYLSGVNYSTQDLSPGSTEKAVTTANAQTAVNELNSFRSTAAGYSSSVSTSDLCGWTLSGGYPTLQSK